MDYQTLVEAVLDHAEEMPDKAAVCFRKATYTYSELAGMTKRAAVYLKEKGIAQGDRVLVTAVSKPEFVVAFLAIQYLNAVAVPLDKNAKEDTVEDIAEITNPLLMLSDTQKVKKNIEIIPLKSILELPESKEMAYQIPTEDTVLELIFTSGTTGKPKGAILSKRCIFSNMQNTWHGIGMKTEDIVLLPLPLNHSFGIRVLRSALYIGGTVVLQNGFAFAKEIENNMDQFHCTGMAAVSASMEVVLGQMQDKAAEVLGKLRYIEISAGSLSMPLRKKLPKLLPHTEIHNTWGSTESGGALFLNITANPDKYTSTGKPLDGIQVKVLDEENKEILDSNINHPGRMALKGSMQMEGYWNQPELTKETLVDGWLLTNDLVYLDKDGYVYMLGRADDMINVAGEKVSPVEVENVSMEYEGIKECACIGVKDEGLGQIPVLYIVANSSYSEQELKQFLANKLEKYKIPKKFLFIDELPRNSMKKLDRKALKKRWTEIGEKDLFNPIIQNILSRRSIRRFLDRHITEPYLEMILKAGRYAPSGHNMQTWRFTVLRNHETIEKLKTILEQVCKRENKILYGFENPDCLVLVSNDRRNPYGVQDSSCAVQNMMLAANSYGIGSVWLNPMMTICDEPEIRDLLSKWNVPNEHIVWSTVALGYPMGGGNMLAKKSDVVVYID